MEKAIKLLRVETKRLQTESDKLEKRHKYSSADECIHEAIELLEAVGVLENEIKTNNYKL